MPALVLLCITRYKAEPGTPLAKHRLGVPKGKQGRARTQPGIQQPACHLGIQWAFCIPARTVPLLTLPRVNFSSLSKAQLKHCFFHKTFLQGTSMPTWCTLPLKPGHLTKESDPRLTTRSESSPGVSEPLRILGSSTELVLKNYGQEGGGKHLETG